MDCFQQLCYLNFRLAVAWSSLNFHLAYACLKRGHPRMEILQEKRRRSRGRFLDGVGQKQLIKALVFKENTK